jgi:hypothetical protein
MFAYRMGLVVPRVRVASNRHGRKFEELAPLDPPAWKTRRMAASVARRCEVTATLYVLSDFALGW